jgi:ABC-2 type transport system ATP-binding protein
VRKHIGYVPQLLSADRELTGYKNLLLSSRLYLIPHAERERKIEEALTMMGLAEVRDRLARDYSGGMLRRLEIAQSTMHNPAILFLDEPTVALDPDGRHTVWDHGRALRQQTGAAIILTIHYMDEAEALCDASPSCMRPALSRSARHPSSAPKSVRMQSRRRIRGAHRTNY